MTLKFPDGRFPVHVGPHDREFEEAINQLARALDRGPVSLMFDRSVHGGATVIRVRTKRPDAKQPEGYRVFSRDIMCDDAQVQAARFDALAYGLARLLVQLRDLPEA